MGPALEAMRLLIEEDAGPFDLIFIDADKPRTPEYFELRARAVTAGRRDRGRQRRARRRPRRGVAGGPAGRRGCGGCTSSCAPSGRVSATTIQTVGRKGYDGFTLALVLDG